MKVVTSYYAMCLLGNGDVTEIKKDSHGAAALAGFEKIDEGAWTSFKIEVRYEAE